MQCGFMLGCGTTDAIFIVRQLQEKHLIAYKPLYTWPLFTLRRKHLIVYIKILSGWAMPTLGTEEWLVHLVQSMYKDVRSRVRVGDGYCQ